MCSSLSRSGRVSLLLALSNRVKRLPLLSGNNLGRLWCQAVVSLKVFDILRLNLISLALLLSLGNSLVYPLPFLLKGSILLT